MKTVLFSELVVEDLDEAKSNLDHVLCITEIVKRKRGEIKDHLEHVAMNSQEDSVQSKSKILSSPPLSLKGNSGGG